MRWKTKEAAAAVAVGALASQLLSSQSLLVKKSACLVWNLCLERAREHKGLVMAGVPIASNPFIVSSLFHHNSTHTCGGRIIAVVTDKLPVS